MKFKTLYMMFPEYNEEPFLACIPLELIGRCGLWKVSIIAHCLMVRNTHKKSIYLHHS